MNPSGDEVKEKQKHSMKTKLKQTIKELQ